MVEIWEQCGYILVEILAGIWAHSGEMGAALRRLFRILNDQFSLLYKPVEPHELRLEGSLGECGIFFCYRRNFGGATVGMSFPSKPRH
jgi:hypothetical protein